MLSYYFDKNYYNKSVVSFYAIAFNSFKNSNITWPLDLSYMYGSDVSTIESAFKNEVNSKVKETLDNWYIENILNKGLSSLIGDAGFCNDRTTVSGDEFSSDLETKYSGLNRLSYNTPILLCTNVTRDLYTLKDSNIGNKALDYSIGLITVDD